MSKQEFLIDIIETDDKIRGISLDGSEHVIGFTQDSFTGGQTRYQAFTAWRLQVWAETVADIYGDDTAVHVGVTPGEPAIAKLDRDHDMGVTLAPRIDPGDDDE